MTDKSKKRRRELAERLNVSRRTAANIIAKKCASTTNVHVEHPQAPKEAP